MTSGRSVCHLVFSRRICPLTLEERRVMQKHSEIGERILVNVDTYSEIANTCCHHHERVDGNGYPDGLNGAADPTSVADHRRRRCI